MHEVEVPHFSLPFRFEGGRAFVNEQDSLDDVAHCVEAVLRYPLGYRIEAPGFGLPDQTFLEGGARLDEITEAIADQEERGEALVEEIDDLAPEARERLEQLLRVSVSED